MGGGLGRTRWAIPEGWIPAYSEGKGGHALESHEAACFPSAGEADAHHPEPIPTATDHARVIDSDGPIAVQHTWLDARQAESTLLGTVAYAAE